VRGRPQGDVPAPAQPPQPAQPQPAQPQPAQGQAQAEKDKPEGSGDDASERFSLLELD
jgi:hypothetical protein